MTALLVALGAALAPGMPIAMISMRELTKLRNWWLLAVLTLGAVWLVAAGEAWLGCIAVWYAVRWGNPHVIPGEHGPDAAQEKRIRPGLITWVGIGATWFLLRSMPSWAWDWLPTAWLVVAAYHVFVCAYVSWTKPSPYERRALFGLWRTKGTQGSPAITALFFALVAPFAPWWFWPVLAVGLYLTWSWLALIGVAAGLTVLYPASGLYIAATVLTLLGTWFISWRWGWKWFEFTPRGDSFDSVINRLILWWLITKAWWAGPRWLGRGPYSLEPELRRWSSRCWIELPNGEACCDPLQHVYEYGLLGVVAVGALVYRLVVHAHLGDSWTAALVGAAVMSWGHYPTRQPAIGLVVLTVAAGVLR